MQRLSKREQYEIDPGHASLKDKRGKRDELKEKKFQSQQQKGLKNGQEGVEEVGTKNGKAVAPYDSSKLEGESGND